MDNLTPVQIIEKNWDSMRNIVNTYASQQNFTFQYKKLLISRFLTENFLLFLLQFMGFMISPIAPPAPLWLASGTACGFIFMRGMRILPGIYLGSFLAFYLTTYNMFLSIFIAWFYSLQFLLIRWLTYRFIGPAIIFYNRTQLMKYILLNAIITASFCLILTMCLHSNFDKTWLHWWLGDFLGMLIFTFALVTLDNYYPEIDFLKNKLMLVFSYSLWCLCIFLLIFSYTPKQIIIYGLTTSPFIFLISRHYSWCGCIAAIFIFGFLIDLAAYVNAPLFTSHFSLSTSIFLQSILLIELVFGLFVSGKAY